MPLTFSAESTNFYKKKDWKQKKQSVEQDNDSKFLQLNYKLVNENVLLFFKLLATRRTNVWNETA